MVWLYLRRGVMHGFYRVAAISPPVVVADVDANVRALADCANRAAVDGVQIAVYPELCLSGYTCSDLFFQDTLLQ